MHEINRSTIFDPYRPPSGYDITVYHTMKDEVCSGPDRLIQILARPQQGMPLRARVFMNGKRHIPHDTWTVP